MSIENTFPDYCCIDRAMCGGKRNGRNVKECVAVDETIRHYRYVPILELLNMPTLSAAFHQSLCCCVVSYPDQLPHLLGCSLLTSTAATSTLVADKGESYAAV